MSHLATPPPSATTARRGIAAVPCLLLAVAALAGALPVRAQMPGTIVTVAGRSGFDLWGRWRGEFNGDTGPATLTLFGPGGIAVDPHGDLFLADEDNNRVRKIAPDGTMTTVAGSGPGSPEPGGFSGDGGPAAQARLFAPTAVALDAAGNLYIADSNNYRVRRVDSQGIVTTVAGNGSTGFPTAGGTAKPLGEGGPATAASIGLPVALAIGPAGDLFISSAGTGHGRIFRVDTRGAITTYAGGGEAVLGSGDIYSQPSPAHTGDGGPAATASLCGAGSIALDLAGNLYVEDVDVRRIDTHGTILSYTGTGRDGRCDEAAYSAQPHVSGALTVDSAGNLYVGTGPYSATLRKIDPGGTVTPVAGAFPNGPLPLDQNGRPSPETLGDGGPALQAALGWTWSPVVDSAGNLYFIERTLDDEGYQIRKIFGAAAPGLLAGRPFPTGSAPGPGRLPWTVIPGDLNGDREITITDVVLLLKSVIGASPPLTPRQQSNADFDGDGRIDVGDVRALLGYLISHPA